MAKPVIMPKFEMAQEKATILRWLRKDGEAVEKGEPIIEIETDKVVMQVEAPASGLLRGILYREGDVVPVTQEIAYIVAPDEVFELPMPRPPTTQPTPQAPAVSSPPSSRPYQMPPSRPRVTPLARKLAAERGLNMDQIPGSGVVGKVTRADVEAYLQQQAVPAAPVRSLVDYKVRATPAARRLALEQGIELRRVPGSGPYGRVQGSDVLAYIAELAASPPAPAPTIVPLLGIRKTIAERMQASAQTAPHITLTVNVDMSSIEAKREQLAKRVAEEGRARLTLTAMLVKAVAWTLKRHPWLNASLRGDEIHLLPRINIGVAVALDEGLIVPVVSDADRMSLADVTVAVNDLTQRARAGRLTPADVTGGTFTLSNLGMFGIDHFTAIINPPETAILAVGRVEDRAVVREGQLVARPMMTMTLSADHRVVDGAMAARFLQELEAVLESPSPLTWEAGSPEVMIRWVGGMAFEGIDSMGRLVPLDAALDVGGKEQGSRPLQVLLMGLAASTAMDVIAILREKGQHVTDFSVRVEGKRADQHPKVYTNITLEYVFRGVNLSPQVVELAIKMSTTKYCPALAMLRPAVNITTTYHIEGSALGA